MVCLVLYNNFNLLDGIPGQILFFFIKSCNKIAYLTLEQRIKNKSPSRICFFKRRIDRDNFSVSFNDLSSTNV